MSETPTVYETSSVTQPLATYTKSTPYDEHGKRLAEFLCKAANCDVREVRAITCRVAASEIVTFTIEKFGTIEGIKAAIDEVHA